MDTDKKADQFRKGRGMFGKGMGFIPLPNIPLPKFGLGFMASRSAILIHVPPTCNESSRRAGSR